MAPTSYVVYESSKGTVSSPQLEQNNINLIGKLVYNKIWSIAQDLCMMINFASTRKPCFIEDLH